MPQRSPKSPSAAVAVAGVSTEFSAPESERRPFMRWKYRFGTKSVAATSEAGCCTRARNQFSIAAAAACRTATA